ncbi:adhesion G-protein coupled receptor G6-like [Octopus vulgaris]|uniref:Adhesion G-protein coupled receptor G6-like n=1 Tax=Octopus vulgaris TaxID=6645 RepID=A0AA36C063_OCTVU|nr:adhesion G-protein coupled receptor G6-like [Octopus vulgaris]
MGGGIEDKDDTSVSPDEMIKGISNWNDGRRNLSKNQISNTGKGFIKNLPELKEIDLSNNKISEIEPRFLEHVPELQKLDLSKNSISKIETAFLEHVPKLQKLNLSNNQISNTGKGFIKNLLELEELDLSNNNISKIEPGFLEHVPKLQKLDLSKNSISKIEPAFLEHVPKLQKLNLSNNQISNTGKGFIKNLRKLEELDLSNNKISEIEPGFIEHVPELQKLDLSRNEILNIEPGFLKKVPELEKLDLSNNQISNIPEEFFDNLQDLEDLNLSNNQITNIGQGFIKNHHELEELNLSGNLISNIGQRIFINLTKFGNLDLSNNNISNIERGFLENVPELQKLDLSNNNISNIERGFLQNTPDLRKLNLSRNQIQNDLSGNNMMCACHLPAVVYYMNSTCSRTVEFLGECHSDLGNKRPIMQYSQCENYSLFKENLQCQTCSGMMCNNSQVTSCPGAEPVCQYRISMNGEKLKFNRSCSTHSNCINAIRENTRTCNKWTNGTSCVACCNGNLCNNNDFMGWTISFEFHLIYTMDPAKQFNENKTFAENVSRVEIDGILNRSQALRDMGIQKSKVFGKKMCNEDTSTNNGTLHWPMTEIGKNATITSHTAVCHTRYCSKTNQNMTSPKCSPFTGIWQDPVTHTYIVWAIHKLKNLTNEGINEENIEPVSLLNLNISKEIENETQIIEFVVSNHEKMLPLISNVSVNITQENILPSVDRIMNILQKIFVRVEKFTRLASRILQIIEVIPEKIPLEEQRVTAIYSNFGIGAAKVEKNTFNGVIYAVSYGTNETEARTEIYNDSNSQVEDMMDFISFPKSFLKHLIDEERSNFTTITFFSLRNDKLYRVIQNSSAKANTKINSHIIAASIPNVNITNRDEPVTIAFNVIDPNATNPQCVYWDESPGRNPHWSAKGCDTSDYEPGKKVFCTCNHLTSFAMLMDVYQNERDVKHSQILSVLSNIGSGISFVCVILTAIVHVYFKNLWKLTSSKVLVNLCVSLAATYFIFLVGFQEYSTTITAVCKAMAAVLHYFLLTSLMGMTVEAIHIYRGLFVFKTIRSSFIKRILILAWGIPAGIVVTTLAINNTDNYIRIESEICWLSSASFYAAFLAPVVIILLFNLIVFSSVMRRLKAMQNDEQVEHKTHKVRVFGIVGLCFLLGLPWILALFAFGEVAEVFKYLFAIFNTLQGMFIFICYCIYKKDTRDIICPYVCKRKPRAPREIRKNMKSSNSEHEIRRTVAETNL